MYVIFENGGKQYYSQIGKTIRLEKINKKIGKKITFNNILMIIDKKNIKIGKPKLSNTNIMGYITHHGRNKKIKIIKFKRRKHYKKQQGHRQFFTDVKIMKINF